MKFYQYNQNADTVLQNVFDIMLNCPFLLIVDGSCSQPPVMLWLLLGSSFVYIHCARVQTKLEFSTLTGQKARYHRLGSNHA